MLAGTELPLRRRWNWSRARPTPSWPRSASSARPTPSAWSSPPTPRPCQGPRQEPQATRLPARGRCRAGGSGARLGRHGAVRRRSGQGPRRLAADGPPPGPGRRGRLRPATTWTLFAGGDIMLDRGVYLTLKEQGRRLPVRRRDGRDHRPLQGLLAARLGHAVHEADRQRGRRPRPHRGRRHRRRQLREPGAEQPALPRLGDQLLGRPPVHRRPGQRRDRLRLARQQPHPRRRRDRPAPDDHQHRRSGGSRTRAPARTRRRRARRPSSRPPGRRSRSSATTRSPAATTRPPTRVGSAGLSAKAVKDDVAKARDGRRGPRHRLSRTGAPSTTRRRSPTRRSWPR